MGAKAIFLKDNIFIGAIIKSELMINTMPTDGGESEIFI